MEYVYKVACYNIWFDNGLIYMTLFSLVYAAFMAIVASFLSKKIAFPVTLILSLITTIIFVGEFVFSYIYDLTFSIYSINMADQAFDFVDIIFRSVKEQWFVILLFFVPLIVSIILHRRIIVKQNIKSLYKYAIIFLAMYFVALLSLRVDKEDIYSPYNLYYNTHAPTITVNTLGLMTEFRLDVSRFLFGFNPEIVIDNEISNVEDESSNEENDILYNKLDLNFDFDTDNNSIVGINGYLKNQKVTNQNEYTGIFEGKNIIYILAEGFNTIAVDENITPTLYKLTNSSFVFENYYSPVFMSTTGGEFQYSTGLIPTQESLNKWKEGAVTFPYAIGNVFGSLGYTVKAYHDWTYTYYKRHVTMPTLGFTSYKACGNGLEKSMNCNIWPPSDLSLMKATIDEFIDEEHFAVHYITVSGHAEYNFFGNNMAIKNKSAVSSLPYSTAVKAYLATQIELDKALEYLLERLEEKGILDDTVIVLSGDHYPYTLSIDEINEHSSYERDELFEVNHSSLIVYNSEVNTTVIDKLACSIDVIPTVLNLFGYEYDSRLLLGKDIMSEHDSLVVFADNSWISEKGRYNATTQTFIPNDGESVESDYVAKINQEVQNRVNVSTQIVSSNYYKAFFDNQDVK